MCLVGDRLEFMGEFWPRIQITPAMTLEAYEPAGASWDGASIPRPFWGIFGHPLEADFRLASYWHDRLCEAAEDTLKSLAGWFGECAVLWDVVVP